MKAAALQLTEAGKSLVREDIIQYIYTRFLDRSAKDTLLFMI
jgi:hypothetical protein